MRGKIDGRDRRTAARRNGATRIHAVAALAVVSLLGCDPETDRDGSADPAVAAVPAVDSAGAMPAIIFLGTSLTAGYGIGDDLAYPALIQAKLDSAGLRYRVVNRGVSGQTSAGGLAQVDWVLRQPVAVLVLELGANDGLRGQSVDSMAANLQEIIDRTRAAHPDVKIIVAGMEAPPNLGPMYTARFREVFPRLARANAAALIPFLLEGVAADPALNQPDGIHPTAEGHEVLAETVWGAVRKAVRR
jgi:acyl-CoA thioesterase-1